MNLQLHRLGAPRNQQHAASDTIEKQQRRQQNRELLQDKHKLVTKMYVHSHSY